MKLSNKIYNIVLVGVGNIGSRHLQSIIKVNFPINVFAIDNNTNSLERAKKILKTVKKKNNYKIIQILKKN